MVDGEKRGCMKKGMRTAVYDSGLCIEAYCFNGIVQPFPNHFHEYYVLGLVGEGERLLFCNNKKSQLKKGSILLFNPEDTHGCRQNDERTAVTICPDKECLNYPRKLPESENFPCFHEMFFIMLK